MPRSGLDARGLLSSNGLSARGTLYSSRSPQGQKGSLQPLYADASGKPPAAAISSPEPGTLVIAGGGIGFRKQVSMKIQDASHSKVAEQKVAQADIPDIRKLAGYAPAALGFVGATRGNSRLISVNTAGELVHAIQEAKGKYGKIVWLGHDILAGGIGKMHAEALEIGRNEKLPREEFVRLVTSAGATPDIRGCFGSEGAGGGAGAHGMLPLDIDVNLTPRGLKKLKEGKSLSVGDMTITSLKSNKSDIEDFIETIRP